MKNILLTLIMTISILSGYESNSFNNRSQNNSSKYIKEISYSLAKQLNQSGYSRYIKTKTLVILSIVELKNYKKTSELGKRISEDLIYNMQNFGYKILDYKASNSIVIDKNGEYLFSRAMKDLKKQRNVTYALSGTYTRYRDSLAINCRIIDIKTSIVVATASLTIPRYILQKIDKKKKQNNWFNELGQNY